MNVRKQSERRHRTERPQSQFWYGKLTDGTDRDGASIGNGYQSNMCNMHLRYDIDET